VLTRTSAADYDVFKRDPVRIGGEAYPDGTVAVGGLSLEALQ
jgi:hypothetical protein